MARLQNLLLSAAAVGGIVRAAARLERWALERAVVLLSRLLMLPGARCAVQLVEAGGLAPPLVAAMLDARNRPGLVVGLRPPSLCPRRACAECRLSQGEGPRAREKRAAARLEACAAPAGRRADAGALTGGAGRTDGRAHPALDARADLPRLLPAPPPRRAPPAGPRALHTLEHSGTFQNVADTPPLPPPRVRGESEWGWGARLGCALRSSRYRRSTLPPEALGPRPRREPRTFRQPVPFPLISLVLNGCD